MKAVAAILALAVALMAPNAASQPAKEGPPKAQPSDEVDGPSPAPAKVDIRPSARDEEIGLRLARVLEATGWFEEPRVVVQEGVVFLEGRVDSVELKRWAGDLARNTQDVVAVVNRIEVTDPSMWDFAPAWEGLYTIWRDFVRSLPFVVFGLLILALSALAGMATTRAARPLLRRRIRARLLRGVVAAAAGVLVFLVGTYIVLRVSGLTQLALTVVGGTGLIGLAVGIAFRDITENFLASIFLSIQRPFETGDLLEVAGITGYVQQLNVRTTVLMTLEGHVVQIPNASVYKSTVRNYTTNCNRREDFVVGVGYGDLIVEAQEVALNVLKEHPAVLEQPEPSVLVDGLGKATVNLRVYFWLDGSRHSWLKVRSSVIRLVKAAFQKHGISMPDEAREMVFPEGVPVTLVDQRGQPQGRPRGEPPRPEGEAVATEAERGLESEAGVIKEQARRVQPLTQGDNLLSGTRDGNAGTSGPDAA